MPVKSQVLQARKGRCQEQQDGVSLGCTSEPDSASELDSSLELASLATHSAAGAEALRWQGRVDPSK